MKADDAKRLKELSVENRRLKKAVADLTLAKQILGEALKGKRVSPPHRSVPPTFHSRRLRPCQGTLSDGIVH